MNKEVEHINEFCKILKLLVNNIYSQFKTDQDLIKIKRKVSVAIDVNPVKVADEVGHYLCKYAKDIYAYDGKNSDFLVNTIIESEDMSSVSDLLPKIKSKISVLSVDEKKHYISMIQKLLDVYITILEIRSEGIC